jgi:hypothetical protein
MKVRISSWLLAGAYLASGWLLFLFVRHFHVIYLGFDIKGPLLTQAIFAASPLGCLLLFAATGVVIILKDLRFRSRYLNLLFTFILILGITCVVCSLFFPLLNEESIS